MAFEILELEKKIKMETRNDGFVFMNKQGMEFICRVHLGQ